MQFNVAQLLKGIVGATREYQLSDRPDGIEDIGWAGPCEGQVHLMRTSRGVLVEAHLACNVRADCSRCLVSFEHPLHVDFEEEFLPTTDVNTGVPLTIEEEDATAFTIDERHILDLTEAIRQYALLELPMQPLCRPECQGLCPVCGANLNQGSCRCPKEPVDSRWAALAALATTGDDEKGAI